MTERLTKCDKNIACMRSTESIDLASVFIFRMTLYYGNLDVLHEAAQTIPKEVASHQQDTLDSPSITLSQCVEQFALLLLLSGMEPLLELIDDEKDFLIIL